MKKILFLLTFILACHFLQAQKSLFAPIPNPYSLSGIKMGAIVDSTSSDFKGFRLNGPMVLYALPNSTIYTGAGITWEHDVLDPKTGKWYCKVAFGGGYFLGGQFAPSSIALASTFGLQVQFFNKLLTVGILYDVTNKRLQGGVGPGVATNN